MNTTNCSIVEHSSYEDIFIFNNVILSYPTLFKPSHIDPNAAEKDKRFSVVVLVSKETDLSVYEKKCESLLGAKLSTKEREESIISYPICDGDTQEKKAKFDPNLKEHWYFTCKATPSYPPIVKDLDAETDLTMDSGKIYGGCLANVMARPYFYDKPKRGIALNLIAVQYAGKGDIHRFGGMNVEELVKNGFSVVSSDMAETPLDRLSM